MLLTARQPRSRWWRALLVTVWIVILIQLVMLGTQIPEAFGGVRDRAAWLAFYTTQVGWMASAFAPRRWLVWLGIALVVVGVGLGIWVFATLSFLSRHELFGAVGALVVGCLALLIFGIWLWHAQDRHGSASQS